MKSTSGLWAKLREKTFREEFVATIARRVIPLQIAALMRARRMNQTKLAAASGLTQGVISRAADPNYGNLTINTIIRIAAGFDVAFLGVFVPFSKLQRFYDSMSEADLGHVSTFEEEDTPDSTRTESTAGGKGLLLEDATAGKKKMKKAELDEQPVTRDDRDFVDDNLPAYAYRR